MLETIYLHLPKLPNQDAYVEADGCLFLSRRWGKLGGVTFRGEEGVFLLEGVFIKWEKISVWWRRNSNLLAWSSACGREDDERKGRKRVEKEMRNREEWYEGGKKEDKGKIEKREGRKKEE